MYQLRQGCDRGAAVATRIMQQNDLTTRLGVVVFGALDRVLDNFVRRYAGFPVTGINAHADDDVPQSLRDNGGFNFTRLVGFSVTEIWRPKQHRRTPGDGLNQPLSGVQFERRNSGGYLTQVRMRVSVIADLVSFVDFATQKIRIRIAILADYEECRRDILVLQNVEDRRRPVRVRPIVESQRDQARFIASTLNHV